MEDTVFPVYKWVRAVRSIDNWNGQPELDRIRWPRKGDLGQGAHANCCKPPRQLHLFNGALVGNGNATVGQKGGRRVGWGVAGSWHRSGDGDGSVDGSWCTSSAQLRLSNAVKCVKNGQATSNSRSRQKFGVTGRGSRMDWAPESQRGDLHVGLGAWRQLKKNARRQTMLSPPCDHHYHHRRRGLRKPDPRLACRHSCDWFLWVTNANIEVRLPVRCSFVGRLQLPNW